jgi:hypothetical protein
LDFENILFTNKNNWLYIIGKIKSRDGSGKKGVFCDFKNIQISLSY